jgi:glutamate/tyrosine decarboxylase-like PLP-dependent enzyme
MTDERWGNPTADLLRSTAEQAIEFLERLPDRQVRPTATVAELRSALATGLPQTGVAAHTVVRELQQAADPGLIASTGPRYFGFVIGGALPAALAADWLATAWDQDAAFYSLGPAAAVVEEVAGAWLLDLFDLPRDAGFGFTTGCQMANFVGLAAARRAVLLRHGWDVERQGLQGAPRLRALVGGERHVTVDVALQMLGVGVDTLERVPVDDQGRMIPAALADVIEKDAGGALIVAAQVGNVNTGASDDIGAIADIVHAANGWLHVDGAFGLWARTSPSLSGQVSGLDRADSWATDMHKWLNVPYDSGFVAVRDAAAHRQSMVLAAAYLVAAQADERDASTWVPESSRRARGFAVYAALRSLGRDGVRELVERCCAHARRFATALDAEPGVQVLNEVVLNQVLVRFGDDDAITRDVISRVQEEGVCWLGGTTWQGRAAMRISVSNWSTTEHDVDLSVDSIVRCYSAARESARG